MDKPPESSKQKGTKDPYAKWVNKRYPKRLEEAYSTIKLKSKVKSQRVRQWYKVSKWKFKFGLRYGFLVGAIFGLCIGSWEAVKHKNLLVIPLCMVTSGVSFAGIMSVSSVVRTQELARANMREVYSYQ